MCGGADEDVPEIDESLIFICPSFAVYDADENMFI